MKSKNSNSKSACRLKSLENVLFLKLLMDIAVPQLSNCSQMEKITTKKILVIRISCNLKRKIFLISVQIWKGQLFSVAVWLINICLFWSCIFYINLTYTHFKHCLHTSVPCYTQQQTTVGKYQLKYWASPSLL